MMMGQARIRFRLSDDGRKRSLLADGDGDRDQAIWQEPDDKDLHLFGISDDTEDGSACVSLDLRRVSIEPNTSKLFDADFTFEISKKRWDLCWHVVPTWRQLIQVATEVRDLEDAAAREKAAVREAERQKADEAEARFMATPSARAEKIEASYATIDGFEFSILFDDAGKEAKRRAEQDLEQMKETNRAALGSWIRSFGNDNQRKRVELNLLPWQEAYDAMDAYLYQRLDGFAPYEKIPAAEVCKNEPRCKIKFKSLDATELTAAEFDRFEEIQAKVGDPGPMWVEFQLREHTAECQHRTVMRRGVIVKFAQGSLRFKREFLLAEKSR